MELQPPVAMTCMMDCMKLVMGEMTETNGEMMIHAASAGMGTLEEMRKIKECLDKNDCEGARRLLLVPEVEEKIEGPSSVPDAATGAEITEDGTGQEAARFLCDGCFELPPCEEFAEATLLTNLLTPPVSAENYIYRTKVTDVESRASIYANISSLGGGYLCSSDAHSPTRALGEELSKNSNEHLPGTSMHEERKLGVVSETTVIEAVPILDLQTNVTLDVQSKCQRIKDVDAGFTLLTVFSPFNRVILQAPDQEDGSPGPQVVLRNFLEIFTTWFNPIVNDDDVFSRVTGPSFANFLQLFAGIFFPNPAAAFPEGYFLPVEPLARLQGLNPNGQWTFIVEDLFPSVISREYVLDVGLSILCADECHDEGEDQCGSCGTCVNGACVEDSTVFCSNQCDQCLDVNKEKFEPPPKFECIPRSCPKQCNVAAGSRLLQGAVPECGPCGMCDGNGKCVENIDFVCDGCNVCLDVNDGTENVTAIPKFMCVDKYCPHPKYYDPYHAYYPHHGDLYAAPPTDGYAAPPPYYGSEQVTYSTGKKGSGKKSQYDGY